MKKIILTIIIMMLSAIAMGREVTLRWDPNSEPDLSHYVVYWGTTSKVYTNNSGDIGLDTSYSCTLPDDGEIYYFAVTAVDVIGLESDYSNEANTEDAIIPDYLYLPPAAPANNIILGVLEKLPVGAMVEFLADKVIVTYPNGMIIEIVGLNATVTQGPKN